MYIPSSFPFPHNPHSTIPTFTPSQQKLSSNSATRNIMQENGLNTFRQRTESGPVYKKLCTFLTKNHELPFPFSFLFHIQNRAMPISVSLSLSSAHHYYLVRGISISDSLNSLSGEIYAPEPAAHSPHQTDPQDTHWAHVPGLHRSGSDSAYWSSASHFSQYYMPDCQAV
jgi:hypothetical protein